MRAGEREVQESVDRGLALAYARGVPLTMDSPEFEQIVRDGYDNLSEEAVRFLVHEIVEEIVEEIILEEVAAGRWSEIRPGVYQRVDGGDVA